MTTGKLKSTLQIKGLYQFHFISDNYTVLTQVNILVFMKISH